MKIKAWKGGRSERIYARITKEAKAKMLEPYYTVNDLVRIAVDRYVCTELLNP